MRDLKGHDGLACRTTYCSLKKYLLTAYREFCYCFGGRKCIQHFRLFAFLAGIPAEPASSKSHRETAPQLALTAHVIPSGAGPKPLLRVQSCERVGLRSRGICFFFSF